ncbi:uncharacterized protein LOC114828623 [Galendromus occidentalis]|uniref:Uncharacterized protein LOC114828623 n=1 Tax=Galendromus occidentalis TaxID=34638 RepID=A0AAJ7WJ97_9ACAR|nr:uncharacterized protein LOC114828623 [Galendromus occidentalis]
MLMRILLKIPEWLTQSETIHGVVKFSLNLPADLVGSGRIDLGMTSSAATHVEITVADDNEPPSETSQQVPSSPPESPSPTPADSTHAPKRRASSRRRKLRKDDPARPHLSLSLSVENTAPGAEQMAAHLSPITPNIEEVSFEDSSQGLPPLLPEFRTALTLVQILGGGGLGIPSNGRLTYSLLSLRAIVTQFWLFIIRLLYVLHTILYLASIYFKCISPLSNVTIFWTSTTLNLGAALSNHFVLNRHTEKLYLLLGTLSARQPKNIKICIVVVLASITAVAAMVTLRFYEVANTHRNVHLVGSKNWTIYTFLMLYFSRHFESFVVVGSTVFTMVLYALVAAAIKFELRAVIEEPVPHQSALVRHSTISKLIHYSDSLFGPLCCLWVAAVIGNVSEGLVMARYHQTDYAMPHITTWAHAIMLCAGYFAVCECSYGVTVESERVRRWIYKHYQNESHVVRYLNHQRRFPKTLKLWESIDLSRQAMVISVAFPVTLYAIILLILDPVKHGIPPEATISHTPPLIEE